MLKIVKMISLYVLAVLASESVSLPPHLARPGASFHQVIVTAYTNHASCGAGNAKTTASAKKISASDFGRVIALSRDIASDHEFGDQFDLWVNGKIYRVTYNDRMPKKHQSKVDLLLPSLKSCRQFGRQTGILVPVDTI